jgi:hypothetical protein
MTAWRKTICRRKSIDVHCGQVEFKTVLRGICIVKRNDDLRNPTDGYAKKEQ